MQYKFAFRPYQRKFQRSLFTHHGQWNEREGIIIKLSDHAHYYGEIAPLSAFGSETLNEALAFCAQLPPEISQETILAIPDSLPACQFGFESAWEGIRDVTGKQEHFLTYSALLAAGKTSLTQWQSLWEQGYRTFKWKIGVEPVATELANFELLMQKLPASAKLRLDANGGLSDNEANLWLSTCDCVQAATQFAKIEFIEQPLPVAKFESMLQLSSRYATAIALDESVATMTQLAACYHRGWRSVFVIKPAIAGSPAQLRNFCHQHQIDAVFSSVFETEIGRQAAIALATELSNPQRAVGFGIEHWFDTDTTSIASLWNRD